MLCYKFLAPLKKSSWKNSDKNVHSDSPHLSNWKCEIIFSLSSYSANGRIICSDTFLSTGLSRDFISNLQVDLGPCPKAQILHLRVNKDKSRKTAYFERAKWCLQKLLLHPQRFILLSEVHFIDTFCKILFPSASQPGKETAFQGKMMV